jgi:2-polyprenyl-3-methyl-5-hydroxy-6-metoxy-1,4-benzoquinol methylase
VINDSCICRGCGSAATANLGPLPEQTRFAGNRLAQSLPTSYLLSCSSCDLLMRSPILSIREYNQLYEQASSEVWSIDNDGLRQDQKIIISLITKNFTKKVKILDVGCYTGDLLSSLPYNYEKFGVEMSAAASQVASKKGIKMLASDLYSLPTSTKFDVITAVDVIEHTQNPKEFLEKLMTLLNPDVKLIISTGNTDAWLWKRLKNRFWYSKFPEHISFIGERWLVRFCSDHCVKVIETKHFNYISDTRHSLLKITIKLILALFFIKPERFSNCTKDHFCFVITK